MKRKLKGTMRRIAGSCLAMLLVAASPGAARAAGYLIYDLSGEALGKASAVVASTREPAAVWFNPAALTEMGHGVSVGGVGVFARSRFEPEAGGEEIKTEPGRFFLPTVVATAKVTDQVAVGFGAFPAFGLAIEWPEDWVGREAVIKAMVETFTLNPTVAVRLMPGLSLGVGFQAVRASVEFINGLPAVVEGTARLGGGTWGYGGNVALLYQPQMLEQLAFGLTYRSRVKLEFTGRVDFDPGRDFEPTLPDQGGTAELTLPDILSFGSSWRVAPAVTLTFDVNYVLWSTYDELMVDFDQAPDLIQTRNNKNAFTLRLGADWSTPVQGLSVRGGFIFDQNPSPSENLAPSLPDANRLDFGAGVGYRWNWARADLGYLLVYFLPSDSTGGQEGPVGTYKSLAQLLGLTLTAMFD
jgi:long-chain fatty acid transport protein